MNKFVQGVLELGKSLIWHLSNSTKCEYENNLVTAKIKFSPFLSVPDKSTLLQTLEKAFFTPKTDVLDEKNLTLTTYLRLDGIMFEWKIKSYTQQGVILGNQKIREFFQTSLDMFLKE